MKILVVCTGNTCRSPMAEGLIQHRLSRKGLNGFDVNSAGTAASVGLPAARFAVQALSEKGIDISLHRSKPVTEALIHEADLILAMEYFHVEYASRLGGRGRTYLVTGYPDDVGTDIVDPIGGSLDEYRAVRDRIDDEVQRIIPYLSRRAGEESTQSHEREL